MYSHKELICGQEINHSGQVYRWNEISPMERDLGVSVDSKLSMSHLKKSWPWQPKGPTVFWGAPSTASPAGQVRWLSHSTLHLCSSTSSTVCIFGFLSTRRTSNC